MNCFNAWLKHRMLSHTKLKWSHIIYLNVVFEYADILSHITPKCSRMSYQTTLELYTEQLWHITLKCPNMIYWDALTHNTKGFCTFIYYTEMFLHIFLALSFKIYWNILMSYTKRLSYNILKGFRVKYWNTVMHHTEMFSYNVAYRPLHIISEWLIFSVWCVESILVFYTHAFQCALWVVFFLWIWFCQYFSKIFYTIICTTTPVFLKNAHPIFFLKTFLD